MTPDWLADDERLMAELRAAVAATSEIPPEVTTAAKAAFELRTLDDELALLTYDSMKDKQVAGTLRSDTMSVRSMVFGIGDVTLDLDILPDQIVGQLSPPMRGSIVIETPNGPARQGEIDALGMVSIAVPTPGEVRFRVQPVDREAFVTEWTRI